MNHKLELERAQELMESGILRRALDIEKLVPCMIGHSERVAAYAIVLGGLLGLPDGERRTLGLGGLVHDVGKVAIPDYILMSRNLLSAEDRLVIRRHPAIGEQICRSAASFEPVLPMVRHHHERLDGTGYPDGLQGEEIPLGARILQTVDIFDALTTVRPYREALPTQTAFEIMRDEVRRGWRDGSLVEEFFAWVSASDGSFSSQLIAPRQGGMAEALANRKEDIRELVRS